MSSRDEQIRQWHQFRDLRLLRMNDVHTKPAPSLMTCQCFVYLYDGLVITFYKPGDFDTQRCQQRQPFGYFNNILS